MTGLLRIYLTALLTFSVIYSDAALSALHKYEEENGGPPDRATPFLKWTEERLVRLFAERTGNHLDPVQTLFAQDPFRTPLKSFAAARGNRSLRRSLAALVTDILDGGMKRSAIRQWVKSIVGTELRADDLDDVGRTKRYRKIRRRWNDSGTRIDLPRLFATLAGLQDLQARSLATLQEEKLAAMKQLAYGASHEINNPLANIASRAQTLLVDEPNPERRRKLATIYEQAMRAHEMISDMMLFANPATPHLADTDLYETVKQVGREMKPNLRQSGIRLRVVQYPDGFRVRCDSTQLAVAVRAMIQNSIEAINSVPDTEGRIDIRIWSKTDDAAAIAIVDNGPGVDHETARHIFDPFYSGREAGRGLGFGLAKAWTIVTQLHGGKLELVPKDDSMGAEFQITLPRTQPNAIRDERDDSQTSAA